MMDVDEDPFLPKTAVVPCATDDRDFGRISDHLTVWVDQHIGEENTCQALKNKFENNVQVLKSTPREMEIDDDSMVCTNPDLLKKLSAEVYCLKYFSDKDKALAFIRSCPMKRIFFISSGTIGEKVVPQLVQLKNVQNIYIFCGNISAHTEWAADYTENISGFLEHQDDLLERLTNDIGFYLEAKGDRFAEEDKRWEAKNCYAWANKLFHRNLQAACLNSQRSINRIEEKLENLRSGAEPSS